MCPKEQICYTSCHAIAVKVLFLTSEDQVDFANYLIALMFLMWLILYFFSTEN